MKSQGHATDNARAPALLDLCRRIADHLRAFDRAEVEHRSQIGLLLSKADGDRATFGRKSLKRVASALGREPVTLHSCKAVAEAFEPEEMERLRGQVMTGSGLPLSWLHYEVLSKVSGSTARTGLAERALKQGLSVKDLRFEVENRRLAEDNCIDGGEGDESVNGDPHGGYFDVGESLDETDGHVAPLSEWCDFSGGNEGQPS